MGGRRVDKKNFPITRFSLLCDDDVWVQHVSMGVEGEFVGSSETAEHPWAGNPLRKARTPSHPARQDGLFAQDCSHKQGHKAALDVRHKRLGTENPKRGVQMTKITRRTLTAAMGLAAPMFFIKNGWAQGKSVNVGIYPGIMGDYVKREVIPKFQSEFGCQVNPTEGGRWLRSRCCAPRRTGDLRAMFMDDVGVPVARDEGLITPLPRDKMPNLERVFRQVCRFGRSRRRVPDLDHGAILQHRRHAAVEGLRRSVDERYRGRYIMPTRSRHSC